MKILAFAASNSKTSINKKLVQYAAALLKEDILPTAEIELLDLNDYEMPIYRPDRQEEGGIPVQAQRFFQKIGEADAVLISFAEHNGSVTAAWKNIFDWMSRIERKLWREKPTILLAASPGARAGQGVLDNQEALMPHFGANLKGRLGIGQWREAWNDNTGRLSRQEDIDALKNVLTRLIEP